jgi:hypothetical protein
MGLFDTVTVDVLSADFQTKQLGEGMLTYRLTGDGRLVAPCGVAVAYHGLIHQQCRTWPVRSLPQRIVRPPQERQAGAVGKGVGASMAISMPK